MEDESRNSLPVQEISFQSDNVFTEFFKQTRASNTKKGNVLTNSAAPLGETGFTGNVASKPIVEELSEEDSIKDISDSRGKEIEVADEKYVKSSSEDTNQSEVISTEAVDEQEVVVIQSFKKDYPLESPTDDGGNVSDIKTDVEVEDKTQPKVRPSIKELKNDLISLSKLIKAAPRREKKFPDQKQSQF